MYEFIRGTLHSKDPGAVVVEAGGIGYRMLITAATYDRLPERGQSVMLHLHHVISPDQGEERLYGFGDETERMIFRQLLEVQRIGPSVALRILSNIGASELVGAIAGGDVAFLKRVKGVGAKMAERLIVELQEPLSKLGILKLTGATAHATGGAGGNAARDAIAALVNLGYRPANAEKAVAAAMENLGDAGNASDLIRAALQLV